MTSLSAGNCGESERWVEWCRKRARQRGRERASEGAYGCEFTSTKKSLRRREGAESQLLLMKLLCLCVWGGVKEVGQPERDLSYNVEL